MAARAGFSEGRGFRGVASDRPEAGAPGGARHRAGGRAHADFGDDPGAADRPARTRCRTVVDDPRRGRRRPTRSRWSCSSASASPSIGKLEDLGLTDSLAAMPNRRALHLDYAPRRAGAGKGARAARPRRVQVGQRPVRPFRRRPPDQGMRQAARPKCAATTARAYRLGGDEFAILVVGPIAGNILEGICHTLLVAPRPSRC